MAKIRKILLVGLGSIGKRHLANIQRLLPEVRVAVLRSRPTNEAIEGCEVVATIDEARAFCPDAAVLCSPSSFHIEVAELLANSGVHLFIEKPLSDKVLGVSAFIEVISRFKLKAMVGYNLRFSPSLLAFKALIEEATFGRVLHVSAEVGQYLPSWRPDVDYRETVSAKAEFGGGALLELSHELDYLCWIFGPAVSVSAKVQKVSELEIDVEDLVLAHIDLAHGERKLSASIHLDFLQQRAQRKCKAICERGTVIWDAIAGRVEVQHPEGRTTHYEDETINRNLTYEKELLAFIEAIENDTQVPIDCREGLGTLELIGAIRESSRLQKVIYL